MKKNQLRLNPLSYRTGVPLAEGGETQMRTTMLELLLNRCPGKVVEMLTKLGLKVVEKRSEPFFDIEKGDAYEAEKTE